MKRLLRPMVRADMRLEAAASSPLGEKLAFGMSARAKGKVGDR